MKETRSRGVRAKAVSLAKQKLNSSKEPFGQTETLEALTNETHCGSMRRKTHGQTGKREVEVTKSIMRRGRSMRQDTS